MSKNIASKNHTVRIRVSTDIKKKSEEILAVSGLSLNDACNLMLYLVCADHGLPIEIKKRLPLELNDEYGSYICEYGHVHNYSNFDFDVIERETTTHKTTTYDSLENMLADLHSDDDDEEK